MPEIRDLALPELLPSRVPSAQELRLPRVFPHHRNHGTPSPASPPQSPSALDILILLHFQSDLTLLLKNAKTTTFLAATPSTALTTVRKQLLEYLRENEQHLEISIPEDEKSIELGAPIDPQDITGGYHVLPDKGTVKECLGDAKDWIVIAWRIKGGKFRVEIPVEEEEEEEEDDS